MASPFYNLVRKNYDLFNPLKVARFQRTSLDFIKAVRDNVFQGAERVKLMNDFCTFVSSKHVWHLAQMVVPEFRSVLDPSAEK